MNPTSVSLLDRLKAARPDSPDWRLLQSIYRPLIERWIGQVPGLSDEAADIAQEVFVVLLRTLPTFDRRREGSFRAWLRLVCVNNVRTHRRELPRRPQVGLDGTDAFLDNLADPSGELSRRWDREHDQHVVDRLLEIVRPDFEESTWRAFRRFALEGKPALEVACETGLSENAVLLAKSRILKRLRAEAGDLLK